MTVLPYCMTVLPYCMMQIKPGDKTLMNNYCSVSLLPILSKILERIVYNQVMEHIHGLFTIHQFGFLTGWSAVQQLLVYIYSLFKAKQLNFEMDVAHMDVNVVYMDFKEAFDSIPTINCKTKLGSIGI